MNSLIIYYSLFNFEHVLFFYRINFLVNSDMHALHNTTNAICISQYKLITKHINNIRF